MKGLGLGTLVTVLALAVLPACGPRSADGSGPVSYKDSARENYEKGMKALKDDEYIAAAKYFVYTKTRFPFSQYSVLAELRLADADMESGHNVEAADGYRQFAKAHPNHEMVINGYAQFRVGEAAYKQIPEDFWLTPPAYEKDQSGTVDAVRELGIFLDRYPSSPYAAKGREKRARAIKMLAQSEMMVARFYWRRDRPRGTILRLESLIRKFPGNALEEDALMLLARAYLALERPDHAQRAYLLVISKYPEGSAAAQARGRLPEVERAVEQWKLQQEQRKQQQKQP
ncbi:MAG: outer membrane protein assembly factor BamD [Deltaproteobacteria bacterium]|nr:outer membrane protein assembly factor BamD [Deltaproteobacteria bacterium]